MDTNIIGVAIGVIGIAISIWQQRRLIKIKERNRAYSWRLANNVHNIMALLEQIEGDLNEQKARIEGESSVKNRSQISKSYQQSSDIVSSIGEFLVTEFNVGRKELQKMREKDFAWGYLYKSIERAIEAVENRKLA